MPEPSNFMNQARRVKEIKNTDGKANDKTQGHRPTFEETYIREIDLDPPEIHGKNNLGLKRLVTDKIMTDSSHHKNGEIKKYESG